MKSRCSDPKRPEYHNYGGKGVYVCDEWQDYTVFKAWSLANGYSDTLTIDRKDSDGPYSPENCVWATKRENSRRNNRNVVLDLWGERKTIQEWGEDPRCIVMPETLRSRLRLGWNLEDAMTAPKNTRLASL